MLTDPLTTPGGYAEHCRGDVVQSRRRIRMYKQVLEKFIEYEEINKKRERMVTMVNLMACRKTENIKQFDQIKTLTSVIETIIIS
jgi:hypothetical protein